MHACVFVYVYSLSYERVCASFPPSFFHRADNRYIRYTASTMTTRRCYHTTPLAASVPSKNRRPPAPIPIRIAIARSARQPVTASSFIVQRINKGCSSTARAAVAAATSLSFPRHFDYRPSPLSPSSRCHLYITAPSFVFLAGDVKLMLYRIP